MSSPASWPQKFDVLRFYIIIQINDKIAKTKARIEPWVKVQEPFLQGHTNLYVGTVGTLVQLVIHQSNRSCSQCLFLPSCHKDIMKPYQICCSRLLFHPSLLHLVSSRVLLTPLQNVSHRSSLSYVSTANTPHQDLYHLPLDCCGSSRIGLLSFTTTLSGADLRQLSICIFKCLHSVRV